MIRLNPPPGTYYADGKDMDEDLRARALGATKIMDMPNRVRSNSRQLSIHLYFRLQSLKRLHILHI